MEFTLRRERAKREIEFQLARLCDFRNNLTGRCWQTARMAKVKVAVLGTGSLGQHHVRIYAELAAAGLVELTGVFDTNADTARKIAAKNRPRLQFRRRSRRRQRRVQHRHAHHHAF